MYEKDIPILSFEVEVKRMSSAYEKLRHHRRLTIYDGSTKTFYRFRINPSERRLYWIEEASLDQRNWVSQHTHRRLRDVFIRIYDNKVKNHIND